MPVFVSIIIIQTFLVLGNKQTCAIVPNHVATYIPVDTDLEDMHPLSSRSGTLASSLQDSFPKRQKVWIA